MHTEPVAQQVEPEKPVPPHWPLELERQWSVVHAVGPLKGALGAQDVVHLLQRSAALAILEHGSPEDHTA